MKKNSQQQWEERWWQQQKQWKMAKELQAAATQINTLTSVQQQQKEQKQ